MANRRRVEICCTDREGHDSRWIGNIVTGEEGVADLLGTG
jgi:hypothetical protein